MFHGCFGWRGVRLLSPYPCLGSTHLKCQLLILWVCVIGCGDIRHLHNGGVGDVHGLPPPPRPLPKETEGRSQIRGAAEWGPPPLLTIFTQKLRLAFLVILINPLASKNASKNVAGTQTGLHTFVDDPVCLHTFLKAFPSPVCEGLKHFSLIPPLLLSGCPCHPSLPFARPDSLPAKDA